MIDYSIALHRGAFYRLHNCPWEGHPRLQTAVAQRALLPSAWEPCGSLRAVSSGALLIGAR